MQFRFEDPYYLLLLPALPLLVYSYLKQARRRPSLRFSNLELLRSAGKPWTASVRHLLFALRLLVLILLVVVLARPQSGTTEEEILTEGIDIVLALDLSTSMLAEDLKPNRVEAAREVAAKFVSGRINDRIGLVVFAANGYTQCPLTLDYPVLLSLLEQIEVGVIDDGTAIGMGLVTAINRLRSSEAESKVIILLTDGRNNRGEIDPTTAAEMAGTLGIRVYTIGAGTRGVAPYPVDDPLFGRRLAQIRVDIDEETLKKVAEMTEGTYFRATDRESLEAIYQEIDQLEKTEIKVRQFTHYSELFLYPLVVAGGLLLGEIGLAGTRFRRIP